MKTFRTLFLCLGLLAPAVHAQLLPGTPAQKAQDAQAFEAVGPLLAAVLSEKSAAASEVFEILRLSLRNQHAIGARGRLMHLNKSSGA